MQPQRASLIIRHANQLLTFRGFSQTPKRGKEMQDVSLIEDGAIAAAGATIIFTGSTEELRDIELAPGGVEINAAGKVVLPGFIDSHTHLIFAGTREKELPLRLKGASYMEILRAGGGIMHNVRATRQASFAELKKQAAKSLDLMLLHGTTTVEAKSGYGLNLEDEIKSLQVIRELQREHPVELVPTFMGAHALPSEYQADREGYLRLLIEDVLPAVRGLARFCDVFCEEGIFTVEESRRILQTAKQYGMQPKIHADELSQLGGAELAAEIGAVSADHLLHASREGIRSMAEAGTICTVLPGTPFCLMEDSYADARTMMELGAAVAVATDFNPGSCPTESMPFIMSLACYKMKMLPEEILSAVTINGAHAVGCGARIGSLEPGKQADILIADAPSYHHLFYHFGINPVETVVKKGKVVVREGRLIKAGDKNVAGEDIKGIL